MKKVNLRDLYPDVYKTDHFVEVTELIPENFKGSLPSIDEIESELRKDTEG